MTKITLRKNGKNVGFLKREEFSRAKNVADRWAEIDPSRNSALLKKGKQKFNINQKAA